MNFDVLARHYNWMEWLLAGQKLQRSRVALLDEVNDAHKVLLVGEGHGRFLSECLRKFPEAEITCLDASEAMLRQARHRCAKEIEGGARVRVVHCVLPNCELPEGEFDLIVSNFFFDCFTDDQLADIISKIGRLAAPKSRWLVAEFRMPENGWRRWRARMILWLAYGFFRLATGLKARQVPQYEHLLAQCGFRMEKRRVTEWGLLTSDLFVRGDLA